MSDPSSGSPVSHRAAISIPYLSNFEATSSSMRAFVVVLVQKGTRSMLENPREIHCGGLERLDIDRQFLGASFPSRMFSVLLGLFNWPLEKILNIQQSVQAGRQASLPVSSGGLSIREAETATVSMGESGAWLNAIPIVSIVILLSDDTVRIAMLLRLGVPMCTSHRCRCRATV
ncbi:hypothetical protein ACOME3_006758 [Neoechinorhynchus agilis]